MSISSEQILEHVSGFEERQEAARDQLLSDLAAYTMRPAIPAGYYTAREMYNEALKLDASLDYEKYRHRLRLMAERGQLAVHYEGRSVYYGIESKV